MIVFSSSSWVSQFQMQLFALFTRLNAGRVIKRFKTWKIYAENVARSMAGCCRLPYSHQDEGLAFLLYRINSNA